MTFRDYSWNSTSMSMMAPQGGTKPRFGMGRPESRVRYEISWTAPTTHQDIHEMPVAEAERALTVAVRTAIHHAVVSGASTLTINVTKVKPLPKGVR